MSSKMMLPTDLDSLIQRRDKMQQDLSLHNKALETATLEAESKGDELEAIDSQIRDLQLALAEQQRLDELDEVGKQARAIAVRINAHVAALKSDCVELMALYPQIENAGTMYDWGLLDRLPAIVFDSVGFQVVSLSALPPEERSQLKTEI